MEAAEDHNPMTHFQQWFHEVDKAHPEDEANAMILSTVGLDGFPKSRIVLLKRFTWEGFIFFTNYHSEKGKAIAKDNRVSCTFNWTASKREVLITGRAEKISENISEGYFESRPEGSKLSAWVSHQSDVISSRKILDDRLKQYVTKFKNKTIPRPKHWGGYIIKPEVIEFIAYPEKGKFKYITKYTLLPNYCWSKNIELIRY